MLVSEIILSRVQKWVGKVLTGCLLMVEELRNSKKSLINIQNQDNECFCCCCTWHLNRIFKHLSMLTELENLAKDKLQTSITKALSLLKQKIMWI